MPNIIMLVEDDPDHELLTLRALRRSSSVGQVVVARDGAQAVEYLLQTGPHITQGEHPLPSVVLLDLNLPKLSGLEVLQQLRADERTRVLPVVILSSSDEESDLAHCYSLGANSFIRKPIDADQFTTVGLQLGEYWLKLNQAPLTSRGGS